MRRVYLDSNVFISLIDREIGKGSRGLFVEAEQFLERVKESGGILVLSKLFFAEIYHHNLMSRESVLGYLEGQGVKIETLPSETKFLLDKAILAELHYADALHAAVALASKCDCIVTFNIKDFEKVKARIAVFEPAEF